MTAHIIEFRAGTASCWPARTAGPRCGSGTRSPASAPAHPWQPVPSTASTGGVRQDDVMDPGIRLKSGKGRWVLLATVLGSGIAFLDATVVNVALPTIGQELHAT